MRIISISNGEVVVSTGPGLPQSKFTYEPVDISTLTVEEAFVYGMAYSLFLNCGNPLPGEESIQEEKPSVSEEI